MLSIPLSLPPNMIDKTSPRSGLAASAPSSIFGRTAETGSIGVVVPGIGTTGDAIGILSRCLLSRVSLFRDACARGCCGYTVAGLFSCGKLSLNICFGG